MTTGNKTNDAQQNPYEKMTAQAVQPGNESEHRIAAALRDHANPVLPAIFNRQERKVVQKALIAELEQGFEHRRKAIGMALESRLHSIREGCNHVLVVAKTQLRQQRIEYYAQSLRQLEHRMQILADTFLAEADQRFERLDSYQHESIRQREKARIENSVDQFLTTIDRMMEEFINIVSEHIDHDH